MTRRFDIPHPHTSPSLRQRAEARIADKVLNTLDLPPRDVQSLVYELQVHQVELEIQNEELRLAQMELADARDRYLDLYQFAPVGYLTVDQRRRVCDANLTAATFLQSQRSKLIGRRLESLVDSADRDHCYRHLLRAADVDSPPPVELRVNRPGGDPRWVLFQAIWRQPDGLDAEWRVTIQDVTARKHAENALRELNQQLERRVVRRTAMLKLLTDIATAANQADDLEAALAYALPRVCRRHCWSFGHAYMPDEDRSDLLVPSRACYMRMPERFAAFQAAARKSPLAKGEGLAGRVYDSAKPLWSLDISVLFETKARVARELGIQSAAAFPILAGKQVVGVLEFVSEKVTRPDKRLLALMTTIGEQLGRVVERERFEHELSRSLLDEQSGIGAELHDTVAQDLAAAALTSDHVADRLRLMKSPVAASVDDLSAAFRRILARLRETVRGIIPPIGVDEPLHDILDELLISVQRRHGVECALHVAVPVAVGDPDVALHLYRIVSEAVGNAVRHSRATRVVVNLEQCDGFVVVRIRDDGRGMSLEAASRGAGMRIMRHRAKMIDARLDVLSSPGAGTEVICAVPVYRLHASQTES